MSEERKLHLELSWLDGKLRADGTVELEIAGRTKGDVVHRVVLHTQLDIIQSFAGAAYRILGDAQKEVDRARNALKGV